MIPNIKQKLDKEYPFRIEMHAHALPISWCSEVYPEELVKIYAELGYDGLVLTDHFSLGKFGKMNKEEALAAYIENFTRAQKEGEKRGLKVYFGAEIRFVETENLNEYLIYGVNKEILSVCYDYLTKGLEAYRKEVSLPNSVFLQAHPCRDRTTLASPELLDGIESLNLHPGQNGRVGIASKYAARHSFSILTAGTDFHHIDQDHEGVTALRCKTLPEDSFALAEILKSQDYLLEIGNQSLVLP